MVLLMRLAHIVPFINNRCLMYKQPV